MLENGIFAVYLATYMSIFTSSFKIIAILFPILNDIIPTKMFTYPYKIIAPDKGTATIFDIRNIVEIVLKFSTAIGNIIISAASVTASIAAIFLLIYLLRNVDIGLFKNTIPSVPK